MVAVNNNWNPTSPVSDTNLAHVQIPVTQACKGMKRKEELARRQRTSQAGLSLKLNEKRKVVIKSSEEIIQSRTYHAAEK